MRLKCVFARFYKSFNFDSVRKSHPDSKPKPWELIDDDFFPYVEVPIDSRITTIVGANESGKSHLLSAIKKAISGDGFERGDLCRYSTFFNVEAGKGTWPHLGLAWNDLTREEADAIRAAISDAPANFSSFTMFREGPDRLRVFFPASGSGAGHTEHTLDGKAARTFGRDFLPRPFEIKADVGLPNSVPLAWLKSDSSARSSITSRRGRTKLIEAGAYMFDHLPSEAQQLVGLFPFFKGLQSSQEDVWAAVDTRALDLARDLLVKLALVDPKRLSELADAIAEEDDGHANALITRINDQLAKHLNFPKFWAQDRDFSLRVSSRDIDLVFTIQDRTGTEYTFAERSHGLKYFLSYLIQARTREPASDQFEILLMDEPDAYLSAEAQQDLLKIFDTFANPEGAARPVQVIYVTHSPFLLDKNYADRIRVLQKGRASEGTRVVKNASQNHYEPLRSALGAYVGETAFVGSCNLLVEGVADQILLAGMSRIIRKYTAAAVNDALDLNRVVIVPCGSASQVPYTVYLTRGRDVEKPPVIALLDSDSAGRDAVAVLRGRDKKLRRLIKPEYVIEIADLKLPVLNGRAEMEIEDLIPANLAMNAVDAYFQELTEFRSGEPIQIDRDAVTSYYESGKPLFAAITAAVEARNGHIDKAGFARALVRICQELAPRAKAADDVIVFIERLSALFRLLNERQRSAERDASRARVATLVDRIQRNFLRDHPDTATHEQARNFLEEVEESLDDSRESDSIRSALLGLRRDFELDENPQAEVLDYARFATMVGGLQHSFEHQKMQKSGLGLIASSKGVRVISKPKGQRKSASAGRARKARSADGKK